LDHGGKLGFRIVIMRGEPEGGGDAFLVHVDHRVGTEGGGGVDAALAQQVGKIGGVPAGDLDGGDGGKLIAAVQDAYTWHCFWFVAQLRRELTRAAAATLDAYGEGIARGFAETEHEAVREFPIFETPRIGGRLEVVRRDPIRSTHVDIQRKISALQSAIGNIQKSNAARAAQKLSGGGGEKITF